jgi:membrane associated rhomboid family serine protease
MSEPQRPMWPMVWPWQDGQGETMHWRDAIQSRFFTIAYLTLIGVLYAIFGLVSSSCSTSSSVIICDFVFRPYNLFEAPHIFVVSLFTSIWFHNSPDHILLIVVVIAIFLQSAEVRIGTKKAMIAMFSIQFMAALFMTLYLYTGDYLHPQDGWYDYGIRGRNYMGGSVGLFGVVGVMFSQIERPFAGALFYSGFEYWNAHIYGGASMYVVLGHVTAFTLGFILGNYWLRQESKQIVTDGLN